MRKIFTFFCAALMSVGMWADPNIMTPTISGDLSFTESTTVTMTCPSPNADIYYTTDGVTDPKCDCAAAPEYKQPITITETTIIKAAAFDGNDWSAVAEVTFTKVPASDPATTYTVTFTNLNNVAKVVENITLPHTFSCDYTNGNGELDLIIQESYNETGGRCSTSRQWPWGGNDNEVVVGHDGNNHFVTINAPFVGTSFMSGYYDGSSFGNFYYSFHITIAAAEPEPLFEISYEDKWLKVNPTDGEGQYFVFVEDKEYYDNRYIQYDQTTMQGYLDYVVGVVVGMSAQSNFVFSGEKDIDPDPIYHTWYDNDHMIANHDYVAFVFKFENDARVGDVEYLAFTYAGEPQGIDSTPADVKTVKIIRNGMLLIEKNGKLYNVMGAEVK